MNITAFVGAIITTFAVGVASLFSGGTVNHTNDTTRLLLNESVVVANSSNDSPMTFENVSTNIDLLSRFQYLENRIAQLEKELQRLNDVYSQHVIYMNNYINNLTYGLQGNITQLNQSLQNLANAVQKPLACIKNIQVGLGTTEVLGPC